MTEEKKKGKKPSSVVSEINNCNKTSTFRYSYSDEHISILFDNARLLTVNQLFTILQNSKFNIFNYKKTCHSMVQNALKEMHQNAIDNKTTLPFFKENAEVILYRRGVRLVDEDALATMFKYVLDAMKYNDDCDSKDYNPFGILADDNPKIIHKITSYVEKGEPCFGIQIKFCEKRKREFVAENILTIHKELL